MKNALYVVLALVALGCGGGGGSLAGGDLSEEECRKMLQKMADVTYANLSPSDMAEVNSIETPEKKEEDVKVCVAEQNWNRAGYECVMRASSEADLKRCVFEND